jgi:hypothetical protein
MIIIYLYIIIIIKLIWSNVKALKFIPVFVYNKADKS